MSDTIPQKRGEAKESTSDALTLKDIVSNNLEQIITRELHAERTIDPSQRAIERITRAIGRPWFFYTLLLFILVWVIINVAQILRMGSSFDPPPFFGLQSIVTLVALLMTTMVLITQNRQELRAEEYRHLELQITLLAEQKATKLIALMEEIRKDLPDLQDREDPEANALKQTLDPHEVLTALEEQLPQKTLLEG